MLTGVLRPVEHCQERLPFALPQKKDAGHPVLRRVGHQVERLGRARQSCDVDQIAIFNQCHPVVVEKQRRQIVANLKHSAGHSRQRNRDLGLIQTQRPLAAMPLLVDYGLARNRERVWIADKEVAVHVVARSNTGTSFLACLERVSRIHGNAPAIDEPHRVQHGAPILIE